MLSHENHFGGAFPDEYLFKFKHHSTQIIFVFIIVQIIVRGQWQWYTIFLGWAFPDEFFYSSSRIAQMIF